MIAAFYRYQLVKTNTNNLGRQVSTIIFVLQMKSGIRRGHMICHRVAKGIDVRIRE